MATTDRENRLNGEGKVRQHIAEAAAILIAEMDPHSRGDLATYVNALTSAMQRDDPDEIAYIHEAIVELFSADPAMPGVDLDELELQQDHAALERHRFDNDRFFMRYHALKQRAGCLTQRDVAERCKLSVNTVNAIETQRVRPQWRTVKKIADGFGVTVDELLAHDEE